MEYNYDMHQDEAVMLSFDPIVLVMDVAKRWLLILLAVLMVGTATYIYADTSYAPVYQTTTTFVVTTRGSSSTVYSNLASTTSLATVFTDLLNSSVLRKTILQEIGAPSFDGTITAGVIAETNLLTVKVTASDPRTAFLVAQAIIDHHEEVTYRVVDGIILEVLQSPTVPTSPRNSANASVRMKQMMILAAVCCSVLLAVQSFLRDAVRSDTEARRKLDCNYLGDIPHEKKYKTLLSRIRHRKTSILITNPATSFRFLENIRKLRRRVEQHMRGEKVLMVTSLLENEGKSTVAVNLALAMAQKQSRVLLIDCDLRKPACYAILEQKNIAHGVRDVLSEKVSLSDALIQDKKSGLYMLLETRGTANSGDLVASENMRDLLNWARREFDFVVLDLPPMAEVSDAESAMELADASLLVVRQNEAMAPAINKAISTLAGGRARLLGCVLNNVRSTFLSSGQGYGYGYGYGYGGYGKYGHYGHYGRYGSYASKSSRESGK